MKRYIYLTLCLTVFLIFNCSVDDPAAPEYDYKHRPEVYQRTLVSIGNSLTAGMQNSGMREDWQEESFPALIADSLGIEKFNQQLFAMPGLGSSRTAEGAPTTPLKIENGNITYDVRTDLIGANSQEIPYMLCPETILLPELYHNLGIPGATTKDIIEATSAENSQVVGNSFFDLVLRNSIFPGLPALSQAVLYDPNYITLWAGNNDILGGVTKGTIVEGVTVTPVAAYEGMMEMIFDSLLTKTEAKIFLANIPPITATPFVTTIPVEIDSSTFEMFSPLLPLSEAEKTAVRFLLSGGKTVTLSTEEDDARFVLLSAMDFLKENFAGVAGGTVSIPGSMTLTVSETEAAISLVNDYNAYLSSKAASEERIYLVDIHSMMNGLSVPQKMFYLLSPGETCFSLDGVHPNSKGYRLVANEFLKVIRPVFTKK